MPSTSNDAGGAAAAPAAQRLSDLVQYRDGSVVSRALIKKETDFDHYVSHYIQKKTAKRYGYYGN